MIDPKRRVKKKDLADAIDNMCKACIWDKNAPGSWRKQVEGCTSPKCPLFDLRAKTYTHVEDTKEI